jgi:hypothetical protein
LNELLTDRNPDKDFVMQIEMKNIVKVEDWYNDKKVMLRKLRNGKGRNPYADSTVWFRLKLEVNDKVIYNNYPEDMSVPVE